MEALVLLADHVAGFKDIGVTFRNGAVERVRLTAPARRRARGMVLEMGAQRDPWPVIQACLPDGLTETEFLDKLNPSSADLVEATCFALAFGLSEDAQKKMAEEGVRMMMEMALERSKGKLPSGEPVTPAPK